MNSIFLSADSTCDMNSDMQKEYGVHCVPIHISLDGEEYQDGVDIDPEFIYKTYREKKILPKTSAVSKEEYKDHFEKLKNEGAKEIIHVSLSSAISSTFKNAKEASDELGNIYVIDSKNLSFGSGVLVLEAYKMIKQNLSSKEIFNNLNKLIEKVNISFLLSTLDFMSAGGRCLSAVALGASFLSIKPCIKVETKQGKMSIAKVYRGKLEIALPKYIKEKLNGKSVRNSEIFFDHSGVSEHILNLAFEAVKDIKDDYTVKVIKAGCTITSHCGPDTFGIIFIEN